MNSAVRHILIGLAALFAAANAAAADLVGVRFGITSPTETRIVIDLTDPTGFAVEARGESLLIDFPSARLKVDGGGGEGHVKGYLAEKEGKSRGRLVFTLSRPAEVAEKFEIPPGSRGQNHRLVIDLKDRAFRPVAPTAVAAVEAPYKDIADIIEDVTAAQPSAPVAPEVPAPPVAAAPAPPKLPVIVIDPGHGGSDPGASSSAGVQEKSMTLAAAKRLAEILEASGRYQIVLTRADDSRMPLEKRAAIAEAADANLFISLHADAHDDPALRGGSIYTLSKDGKGRSLSEAESTGNYHDVYGQDIEEWSRGDPALNRALYELAQTKTAGNSGLFANFLLKRLKGVTPLLNNTHRSADLRVLLSPDVPAVLFELAFISNDKDAANLASPAWRTRTMTAVATAIDDYFRSNPVQSATTGMAQTAPAGR